MAHVNASKQPPSPSRATAARWWARWLSSGRRSCFEWVTRRSTRGGRGVDPQLDQPNRRQLDVDAQHMQITLWRRRGIDAFALAVDMPDRAERLDLPAREVDAVDTIGRVIGGEPHGTIVDIGALHVFDAHRHPQRWELAPSGTDLVAHERVTPEAIHRISDVRGGSTVTNEFSCCPTFTPPVYSSVEAS